MKNVCFALFASFGFLLSSCGDSPDAVADDMKDLFEEMTEIIKDANESGDYKAAIDELKDLEDDVKDLKERGEALKDDMSEEEEKEFEKKHKDELEEVGKALGEQMKKAGESGKDGANELVMAVVKLMGKLGD